MHKVRDELRKRIPYYENATFRKENSLKIQITNVNIGINIGIYEQRERIRFNA